jgi:hypothetical protein
MLSRYMIHTASRPWHIASQVGTAAVGNGYIGPPATHTNRGDPVYSGATEAERVWFRMPFDETLNDAGSQKNRKLGLPPACAYHGDPCSAQPFTRRRHMLAGCSKAVTAGNKSTVVVRFPEGIAAQWNNRRRLWFLTQYCAGR